MYPVCLLTIVELSAMKIMFKLYASFDQYLPAAAEDHKVEIEVPEGTSPMDLFRQHGVPLAEIHLVMINGVFVPPGERENTLVAGDELAAWPAVAGG